MSYAHAHGLGNFDIEHVNAVWGQAVNICIKIRTYLESTSPKSETDENLGA